MKIRAGFVSNSSSSCFICGLWGSDQYKVEETTIILQKILDFYNDLEDKNLSWEKIFGRVEIATKEDLIFLRNWRPDLLEDEVVGKLLIKSAIFFVE